MSRTLALCVLTLATTSAHAATDCDARLAKLAAVAKQNPTRVSSQVELAWQNFLCGEPHADAIKMLQHALTLSPKPAEVGAIEYNLGRIFAADGDVANASTHYYKSLAARPNPTVAKYIEQNSHALMLLVSAKADFVGFQNLRVTEIAELASPRFAAAVTAQDADGKVKTIVYLATLQGAQVVVVGKTMISPYEVDTVQKVGVRALGDDWLEVTADMHDSWARGMLDFTRGVVLHVTATGFTVALDRRLTNNLDCLKGDGVNIDTTLALKDNTLVATETKDAATRRVTYTLVNEKFVTKDPSWFDSLGFGCLPE